MTNFAKYSVNSESVPIFGKDSNLSLTVNLSLKKIILSFLLSTVVIILCFSFKAAAQVSYTHRQTVLTGIVTDSVTGEPLPFVNIFLKDTDLGVTADKNGRFDFVTDRKFNALSVSSLGYESKDFAIVPGSINNNLNLRLAPSSGTMLQEVVITKKNKVKYSKKNNPAVDLMERIRKEYPKHNPLNHDYYNYDKYDKMVVALNDFSLEDNNRGMMKKFKFLTEFCDTSELSGKPILPISVREKASRVLNRNHPSAGKEVVTGLESNGVTEVINEEMVHLFMEEVFREIDIFQNDVTLMQNRFVSPLSNIAANYYKFYLGDTIPINGVPHIELQFVPHNTESFGFTGRIYVMAGDSTLFISKIVMRVPKAINLNYVKDIYIVQDYTKAEDGSRLKVNDDMTAEFEIIPGTQGLYARRQTAYANFEFDVPDNEFSNYYDKEGSAFVDDYAAMRPEEFWVEHRLIPIKEGENTTKNLLGRLEQIPVFYWAEKILVVLVTGYIKTGENSKFDIGPMNTLISANTAEGTRFRVGGMTTANLSKHLFARGYVAYGTKDEKVKYGGELEYSFTPKKYHSREFPINSIMLEHQYDIDRIGQHYLFTNSDNVFLSWKRQPDTKVTYRRRSELTYKMERRGGFSFSAGLKHEIQQPSQWLPFENGYGNVIKHYTQGAIVVGLRFAPGEKFFQTKTERLPLNLDAWVLQLTHEYGPKGFLGSDFTTNKTEFSVQKRFWFSSFGYTDVILKAGKIWSQVYYPALLWPNANLSYTIQPESYPLMNAMEFANDQYVSWDLTYWGNGVLFNRIPALKSLKLREVVSFRGLYGSLSHRNNPEYNNELLQFPFDAFAAPMQKKPYMEIGVGIDNILTFLRVDYVWRLTYRDTPNVDKSGIRVQLHFTF